jgi:hypothetical protein
MFKNLLNDLHIAYDEMQNNNDTISPYDAPARPTSFCTFTNKRMVTPQLGQQFNTERFGYQFLNVKALIQNNKIPAMLRGFFVYENLIGSLIYLNVG